MSQESFKASELHHVPGQEGMVRDINKAREMARTEDHNRSLFLVAEYKKYLEDPFKENPFSGRFEQFREYGVTPEYLEKLSEIAGERVGAEYDAEQMASTKSNLVLHFEKLLASIAIALNSPDKPSDTLPPSAVSVNSATKNSVAWGIKGAAADVLLERYLSHAKAQKAKSSS